MHKQTEKGSGVSFNLPAKLFIPYSILQHHFYHLPLVLQDVITRQMLGASWGEPERVFEVNKIYWHLCGINRHV